jgi:hypothetical protein
MATSLRVIQLKHRDSWKGDAIQRGLKPGSRGRASAKICYQETSSADNQRQKDLICVLVLCKM